MSANQYSFSLVFAVCVIALSSFSPAAHAAGATQFTYSPIYCQTFGGSHWLYPSGQLGNKGDDTMRVFCPLIHEAKHEHSGKLQISVVQANRAERVQCRAFFNHPHANDWASNNWQGESEHSAGVETATITLSGSKYLGGSNMIECKIPPRSKEKNFEGVSRIGTYKSGVD